MDDFGRDDPREMPPYFTRGAVRVDYSTAVRADADKQTCSICPRYWYMDTVFRCARCAEEFAFSASEQKVWYEEYAFWIDSLPKHCLACRRELRELKTTRQEYDRSVDAALHGDDLDLKRQLAGVIDTLYELGGELPARIHEKRTRLARQIEKAERRAG